MKIFKIVMITIVSLGILFITLGLIIGGSFIGVIDIFNQSDEYEKQDTIYFDQEITSIYMDLETRNIQIISSDESQITIDYYEKEGDTWDITLNQGVLSIEHEEEKGIFNWFNLGFIEQDVKTIIIMIPYTYQFDMDVETNTGDVSVKNFDQDNHLGEVLIESNTGDVSMDTVFANHVEMETDTGSIKVKHATMQSLDMETDTGDIIIDDVVVEKNIEAESSTGSTSVNNVTAQSISVVMHTGDIDVEDVTIDQIDLKTNTGDIEVVGVDLLNRTINLSTSTGDVEFDGHEQGKTYTYVGSLENYYIVAKTNTGDIEIND